MNTERRLDHNKAKIEHAINKQNQNQSKNESKSNGETRTMLVPHTDDEARKVRIWIEGESLVPRWIQVTLHGFGIDIAANGVTLFVARK